MGRMAKQARGALIERIEQGAPDPVIKDMYELTTHPELGEASRR